MTNDKLLEKIKTLEIICGNLIEQIKKLEQAQTYFPLDNSNQTSGLDNIKIGNYKEGEK